MAEVFKGELLLLNATRNRVTFAVPDPNPFWKSEGRFMGAIVPVGDDETSPEMPEDATVCEFSPEQLASALREECREMLQRLDERMSTLVTYAVMLCKDRWFMSHIGVGSEDEARAYLLGYCRMTSRSQVGEDGPRHKFLELYKSFRRSLSNDPAGRANNQ